MLLSAIRNNDNLSQPMTAKSSANFSTRPQAEDLATDTVSFGSRRKRRKKSDGRTTTPATEMTPFMAFHKVYSKLLAKKSLSTNSGFVLRLPGVDETSKASLIGLPPDGNNDCDPSLMVLAPSKLSGRSLAFFIKPPINADAPLSITKTKFLTSNGSTIVRKTGVLNTLHHVANDVVLRAASLPNIQSAICEFRLVGNGGFTISPLGSHDEGKK